MYLHFAEKWYIKIGLWLAERVLSEHFKEDL